MRGFGILMILIATVILVSGEYAADHHYQSPYNGERHYIDVMP